MTKEQEIQQKYLELQMIAQQVQQLQQQVQELQQQTEELTQLNSNIDDIKKTKKGTPILTPIGAGIFIKTKAEDISKVIMNVGSKVAVEKPLTEAKKIIEAQTKEMEKLITQLEQQLQKSMLYAQVLQQEMEKYSAKQ